MDFSQRRRRTLSFPDGLVQNQDVSGNVAATAASALRLNGRQFRRPRHAGLLEAVHRLDGRLDEAARRELARSIGEQYSVDYGAIPLGFLALCHLGPPYVDHRLSLIEAIVEHYSPSDPVPSPFAEARALVRSGAYEYVEIFANGELVPVRPDGSIARA